MLVSQEAIEFPQARELFVIRPVGKLILKGRTTPTFTHEVICKRASAPLNVVKGAEAHQRAFDLFCQKRFTEARALFYEAREHLSPDADGNPQAGEGDRPSLHLLRQCERYMSEPPPEKWDGSEHLTKKAW